jgi:hypothetical protein
MAVWNMGFHCGLGEVIDGSLKAVAFMLRCE